MNQGGVPFYLNHKTRQMPKEGYAMNKHTPDENTNTADWNLAQFVLELLVGFQQSTIDLRTTL